MALTELSHSLDMASYGAYVMDLGRRILFWNRSAERILGHRPEEVAGRQCYEVLLGLPEQPSTPTCGPECLTVHLAEARLLAPVAQVRMRCASGARKRVSVMALQTPPQGASVLVHLFHERPGEAHAGHTPHVLKGPSGSEEDVGHYSPLTFRELEVVRLLAARESVAGISARLHLSSNTVLNYIRNAREKLHAASRLELVLTAMRLGLVQPPWGDPETPPTGRPRKN